MQRIMLPVLMAFLSAAVLIIYFLAYTPKTLTFSDSARYSDVARSWINGQGMRLHHVYFSSEKLNDPGIINGVKFSDYTLHIIILGGFFKLFGISDQIVFIAGLVFFSACAFMIYSLVSRLHTSISAVISVWLFISNAFFLEYGVNFTTEILFIFELLLFGYLLLFLKKYRFLLLFPLCALFYTRPQAILVVLALALTYTWINLKKIKFIFLWLGFSVVGIYILHILSSGPMYFNFRHFGAALLPAGENSGQFLRGNQLITGSSFFLTLASKTFYNIYNFMKSPERLIAPVILFGFWISFFFRNLSPEHRRLNVFTFFASLIFILAASISLPNARYVHPITVFIIILFSVSFSRLTEKLLPATRALAILTGLAIITLPVWGMVLVDYQFRKVRFSLGKPPIYRQLSSLMAHYCPQKSLVITNLDAWGAWYTGRTTMWFPITPDQLQNSNFQPQSSTCLFISNYQEQDADFALGDWKEVVYSPDDIHNPFLANNYRVTNTFTIHPEEVYEKQEIKGTVLIRNR